MKLVQHVAEGGEVGTVDWTRGAEREKKKAEGGGFSLSSLSPF